MSVDQDIVDSTETLKADVKITHDIVHGSNTTSVTTEGGPVPSHAKVAKDSHDEIIGQLQPTVKSINDHARLVSDKASDASSSASEAVNAKNDAVKVVYDGDASLDPAPGKIPVADSEGNIHHGFLPDQSIPFPDFWLPLNDSLQILAGEGKHDQVDVSDAQDGSEMVDLPTKSAEFSRATTATYVDKSGVLRTAGVNEPRFEKNGILVEGSSTNLFRNNNLSRIDYVANATQSMTIDPVVGSVFTITIDRDTSGQYLLADMYSGNVNAIAETDSFYTWSFFFRKKVGNAGLVAIISGGLDDSGEFESVSSQVKNVISNLFRAECTYRCTKPGKFSYLRAYIDSNGNNKGDSVEIFGHQLEKLPLASSYIPTDGSSVTRGADKVSVPFSGNFHASQPMTISVIVDMLGIIGTAHQYAISIDDQSPPKRLAYRARSAGTTACAVVAANGSTAIDVLATVSDKQTVHLVVFDDNGTTLYLDGEKKSSSTYTLNAEIVKKKAIIGALTTTHYLFGHVKSLKCWGSALSAPQIAALGAAK